MSDCCDIHSGVKPATHRVLLYEPGREPRRYDVCYECGEAMYKHNAAKLRQTGQRQGQRTRTDGREPGHHSQVQEDPSRP